MMSAPINDTLSRKYHEQSERELVLGKYPLVDITDRSQLPKTKHDAMRDGNPCCYRVLLSSCQLSDENSGKLARIQYCKLLITLDLSHNELSDTTCQMIASAIKHGGLKLKDVNLSYNLVTDIGAGEMADLLGQENVSSVYLYAREEQNNENSLALLHSFGQGLRTLNLSHNRIANNGGNMISQALPLCTTLREINLECNFITNFQDLVLSASQTISSEKGKDLRLRLDENSYVADFDAQKHQATARIQSQKRPLILYIAGCKIGSKEIKWLSQGIRERTIELKGLIVDNNALSNEDCKELFNSVGKASAPFMQQLSLKACSLGDDMIATILSFAGTNDIEISLDYNWFSPLGSMLLESMNWQPKVAVEVTAYDVAQVFDVQSMADNAGHADIGDLDPQDWCHVPVVIHGKEEWLLWRFTVEEHSKTGNRCSITNCNGSIDRAGIENVIKGFSGITREFPWSSVPCLLLSLSVFANFIDSVLGNTTEGDSLVRYMLQLYYQSSNIREPERCVASSLQELVDQIGTALANCVFEPTARELVVSKSEDNNYVRFSLDRKFLELGSIVDNTSTSDMFSTLVKPYKTLARELVQHISLGFFQDPFDGKLPTRQEVQMFCLKASSHREESTGEAYSSSKHTHYRSDTSENNGIRHLHAFRHQKVDTTITDDGTTGSTETGDSLPASGGESITTISISRENCNSNFGNYGSAEQTYTSGIARTQISRIEPNKKHEFLEVQHSAEENRKDTNSTRQDSSQAIRPETKIFHDGEHGLSNTPSEGESTTRISVSKEKRSSNLGAYGKEQITAYSAEQTDTNSSVRTQNSITTTVNPVKSHESRGIQHNTDTNEKGSNSAKKDSCQAVWPETTKSHNGERGGSNTPGAVPPKRNFLHSDPTRWSTVLQNVKRNYKFCDRFTQAQHETTGLATSPEPTSTARSVTFSGQREGFRRQADSPNYVDNFSQVSPVTPLSGAASSVSDSASVLGGSGQLSERRSRKPSEESDSAGSSTDSGQLESAPAGRNRLSQKTNLQSEFAEGFTQKSMGRSPSPYMNDKQLAAWKRQGFVRIPSGTLKAKLDNSWKDASLTISRQHITINAGRILRSRSFSLRVSHCRVRKLEPSDVLLLEYDGRLREDIRLELQDPDMQPVLTKTDPLKYFEKHPSKDVPLTLPITAYYLNMLFEEFL